MAVSVCLFGIAVGKDAKKSDTKAPSKDFSYDSKNMRDPFTPLGKGRGGIYTVRNLKIEGIISDNGETLAVLSGKVVRVGDSIFDAKVVSINDNKVELIYKGESVILKMQKYK